MVHDLVYLGFVVSHGDVKGLAFDTKRMSLKELSHSAYFKKNVALNSQHTGYPGTGYVAFLGTITLVPSILLYFLQY